jgi:hypothetical protein
METGFDTYMNSGYVNRRNRKTTLILDVDDSTNDNYLGGNTEFKVRLLEPLIIDKHSEIYLDNFLTFNANISQTPSTSAFLLKINEFNINTNVASTIDNGTIFNKLIIPNESSSPQNYHTGVMHKGKKFNYVCDINPCKISILSGNITDLGGNPMFHGQNTGAGYTYTIAGITSGKLQNLIKSGTSLTRIKVGTHTISSIINGSFPATFLTGTTSITFSSDVLISESDAETYFADGQGDIEFNTDSGLILVTNGTVGDNPNLHLINNPGRFIAEFSIISRE